MESSKVPVSMRIARMNNLFLGRAGCGTSITKKHFIGREGLLDALIVLYDECNNDTMKKDKYVALFVEKFRSIVAELRSLRVNISDFEVKKVIGRGHFGQVQVVREKQTGNVYAMKTLRKSDTLNQTAFYEEERDIMAFCSSPWLTSLQYAFQDTYNLYLVMEFHPGGDLQALLDRFDGVLDEDMTRFYLAELVLAVSSLHAMGYVHRDVKPENILLDRCGHLKLADFGSAAKLSASGMVVSSMPVGTPDYIAPEVLEAMETFCAIGNNNKKHHGNYGRECDYWSLGIIAYEMVVGDTPFSGNQLVETYSNIMNHKSRLEIPAESNTSQAFADLVNGLLTDAASRLTHEKLIKHPFFTSINWNTLRNTVPPYLPVVNGNDDTSNFMEFEPEPPTPSIEHFKTKKEFSGRNLPFVGFTYTPSMDVTKTQEKGESSQLEEVIIAQKKEIDALKQQLTNALDSVKTKKDADTVQRQLDERTAELARVQEELRKLEYDLDQCRKCEMNLKRTLAEERKERQIQESKALALVQNTKTQWMKKHKEEIAYLNEKLDNQKDHITMLCTKNNELVSRVERQEEELKQAYSEITMLQSMLKQSRSKVEEVRKTSRQSIVGAESKLEQLTMDSNSQLTNLQIQFANETKLRLELQDQLRELTASAAKKDAELQQCESEKSNLASEMDILRKKCSDLEKQIQDMEKKEELAAKAHIAELKEQLRREKQECSNLRVRLNGLENELSESLRSQESSIANREMEREKLVATLESELKKAAEEKMRLQQRLQQVSERKEEENRKVEKLEGLLNHLQDRVSCLEQENQRLKEQKGSEAENKSREAELEQQRAILVAQVEKMEAQLEKVREVSILDRQAAKTIQDKLWKKEKELADAQIDLRIARREMKTFEEQLKLLTDEKHKIEAEKSSIIDELHGQLDTLNQRIATLESDLEAAKRQEDVLTKQIHGEKALVCEKTLALESSKAKIQSLQHQLEVSERQLKVMNQQAEELQSLNKTLVTLREDNLKLEAEVEQLKRKICGLEMNYNCLKDVCTINDEQLEEFVALLDSYKEKEISWGKEKEELDKRISSLEDDIKKARQATNEEKSLRIRVELRLQSLEMDAETQAANATALQGEVEHYKNLSEQRAQQIVELEQQVSELVQDLQNAKSQIGKLDTECNALKEETSSLLTQIYSLKESNLQLSNDLQDASENNKQLKNKYEDLEASFAEMEEFYKLSETKAEATMQQQTKLIEFLQTLLQQGNKKKRTLKDKLFGSKQKENVPPTIENHPLRERTTVRPVIEHSASTPPSKKAVSHLLQSPGCASPGTLARQPSLQRMHHKIPHRFEHKLCKKTSKCAACQQSINFGQNISACQDCHITSHSKCTSLLPTNCGLPSALVQHFSQSWNANKDSEKDSQEIAYESMEGFVKIPKRRACWERKYAKLDGIKLLIYDDKPVSQNMTPISTFSVCCPEGNTTIVSSVTAADIANTANSDLPYIIKIDIIPRTTCWPGRNMMIMALSSLDKQKWVAALEATVKQYKASQPQDDCQDTVRYKGKILLSMKENDSLDLNCALQLNSQVLLLGAEEGLFSFKLQEAKTKPLKIEGTTHVHQITILPMLQMALLLTGSDRLLMECDLRQLKNSAMTIECAEPSITLQQVLKDVDGILIFGASTTMDQHQQPRTIVCAATEKQIVLLTWNVNRSCFLPIRYLETNAPCTCIHFSRYSMIVGCDKFFEIELSNFRVEEFLDASDNSLRHVIRGTGSAQNYPIAVLDVAKARSSEPEYLLCFHHFGVFVDKYGQRSRSEDIKWSHVPISFVYRRPYLFIVHFTSLEVMKLTDTSFKRNEDESNSSLCSSNSPDNVYIEMSNPKYLGVAEGTGPAIYIGSSTTHLLLVEGALAIGDDSAESLSGFSSDSDKDGTELNGGGSLEFSFTSSLEDDLESDTKQVHFREN